MITEKIKAAIKKHKDLVYKAFLENKIEEQKNQENIVKILQKILYE